MEKKENEAPERNDEEVGYVTVACATAEVMLAVRAYLGGVKTGLGPRMDEEAIRRRELIRTQEERLVAMEKTLEAAEDQSQSVTVIFTTKLNRALEQAGFKPLT